MFGVYCVISCFTLFFREYLMILDSASRLNSHLPTTVSAHLQSDVDYYMQLRKEICELMAYTRCYIARYSL